MKLFKVAVAEAIVIGAILYLVRIGHAMWASGLVVLLLVIVGYLGYSLVLESRNRLVDDSVDVHKPYLVPAREPESQFHCATCKKQFHITEDDSPTPIGKVTFIGGPECESCFLGPDHQS